MGSLEHKMLEQAKYSLAEADVIFFMLDIRAGVTAVDKHFAQWLRKEAPTSAQVHLIANKAEGDGTWQSEEATDCVRLGFGSPVLISAEHG